MANNESYKYEVLTATEWKDYLLLDSGNNRRLEKFGPHKLIRPDKQAIWLPGLADLDWKSAYAEFIPEKSEKGGRWNIQNKLPLSWHLKYGALEFKVVLGESKNIGVFPEQATQWDWLRNQLTMVSRPVNILNLFGYTGLASLSAARAGAHVTHVDASKHSVSLARENQQLSGLSDRPIRWIIDDVFKFVKREFRRGKKYDGILMDPPRFGRGPKGEIWDIRKMLPNLLDECMKIMTFPPSLFLVTIYAIPLSAITLQNLLEEYIKPYDGNLEIGEIGLHEKSRGRILPTAVFARWSQT